MHYTFPVLVSWGACWPGSFVLRSLFNYEIVNLVCQYSTGSRGLLPFGNIQSEQPGTWPDASLEFDTSYRVQELRLQTYRTCPHVGSPRIVVRLDGRPTSDDPPRLTVEAGRRVGVDVEACACGASGHALVTMYLVPI